MSARKAIVSKTRSTPYDKTPSTPKIGIAKRIPSTPVKANVFVTASTLLSLSPVSSAVSDIVSDVVDQKISDASAIRDWSWACRECGVSFAKKGTKEYDAVMEKFKNANPIQVIPGSWNDCCRELGFPFVRKDTPEYKQVLELFKSKGPSPVELPVIPGSWNACCRELGFPFVRKETPEYDRVSELFFAKKAESDLLLSSAIL